MHHLYIRVFAQCTRQMTGDPEPIAQPLAHSYTIKLRAETPLFRFNYTRSVELFVPWHKLLLHPRCRQPGSSQAPLITAQELTPDTIYRNYTQQRKESASTPLFLYLSANLIWCYKSLGRYSRLSVDRAFFNTLPTMEEVDPSVAEMAWFVYDLEHNQQENRFHLNRIKVIYTQFHTTLNRITVAEPGDINKFIESLQEKLDKKLENGYAPDAPTLFDVLDNSQ